MFHSLSRWSQNFSLECSCWNLNISSSHSSWHQEHYLSMTTLVSATLSAGISPQEMSLTGTFCLSLLDTKRYQSEVLSLTNVPPVILTCGLMPPKPRDFSWCSWYLLMFLRPRQTRQTGNVPGLVSNSTSPLWHDIQYSSWHISCQPDVPDTSRCSWPFLRNASTTDVPEACRYPCLTLTGSHTQASLAVSSVVPLIWNITPWRTLMPITWQSLPFLGQLSCPWQLFRLYISKPWYILESEKCSSLNHQAMFLQLSSKMRHFSH